MSFLRLNTTVFLVYFHFRYSTLYISYGHKLRIGTMVTLFPAHLSPGNSYISGIPPWWIGCIWTPFSPLASNHNTLFLAVLASFSVSLFLRLSDRMSRIESRRRLECILWLCLHFRPRRVLSSIVVAQHYVCQENELSHNTAIHQQIFFFQKSFVCSSLCIFWLGRYSSLVSPMSNVKTSHLHRSQLVALCFAVPATSQRTWTWLVWVASFFLSPFQLRNRGCFSLPPIPSSC